MIDAKCVDGDFGKEKGKVRGPCIIVFVPVPHHIEAQSIVSATYLRSEFLYPSLWFTPLTLAVK